VGNAPGDRLMLLLLFRGRESGPAPPAQTIDNRNATGVANKNATATGAPAKNPTVTGRPLNP
jgi:hypothetical protein